MLGYIFDLFWGDPRWLPHPVRLMGKAVYVLESFFLRTFKGAGGRKIAGLFMVAAVGGGSYLVVYVVVKAAFLIHPFWGAALSAYLFYAAIAVKDMLLHVDKVREALDLNDLALARERVGLIVSRDTADLSEEGVVRAALESLFENTADGVVAPLFYAALGGPALALFYKAVSTMDSMVGYKTERHYHLGWAAARLDDLLNFIPARLTALLYLLAGAFSSLDWKKGWKTILQDRNKDDSPNSAWPEAAAAGILGIRLGGVDFRGGEKVARPFLNAEGSPPRRQDLRPAMILFKRVSFLALLTALLLALFLFQKGTLI